MIYNQINCMIRPLLVMALLACGIATETKADEPKYQQAHKVLTKYCAGCHNADEANGDFALDSFASLIKGGESGNALTPGSAKSSRLILLAKGKLQPKMPPEGEATPSDDELQIIADWIDAGAVGPKGESSTPTKLDSPNIKSNASTKPITALALSKNEKLLAIGQFGSIEIKDARTNKSIQTISELAGKVTSVRFIKDDQFLLAGTGVTGLYGEAVLIDLAENKVVRTFKGHRDLVYSVAISQDENWLATSAYDKKAVLWKLASNHPIRKFLGHNDAVFECSFDPTAQLLLTASADATVKVWDISSGERLDTRGEPLKEQYTVAISPNSNSFFAGGEDNRIRKWSLVSRKPNQTNPLLVSRFAHESAIQILRFHPDGEHLVSVAASGQIKIWDPETLIEQYVFTKDSKSAQAIAVGSTRIFVGKMDGQLITHKWPVESLGKKTQIPSLASNTKSDSNSSAKETKLNEHQESEPNNVPKDAKTLQIPFQVTGVINAEDETDIDLFRFKAKKGERLVIETKAARNKSPIDTQLAILDTDGKPVPRVLLHAIRDSYFTFRGKNSTQTADFRIHNWEEMQLNQLLYCNGEVVKLYHYPRGPDSGYNVYPNFGNRHGMFDTTPIAHALHEPCYIVEAYPPGTELPKTGLPDFLINYENDDESTRRLGKDSRVSFVAPADGEYLVQVKDSRAFQGEKYKYELSVKPAKSNFRIKDAKDPNPKLIRGTHKKMHVTIERDHFSGPVDIQIDDLPEGIIANGPITIEPDGLRAFFTLYAGGEAQTPDEDAMSVTLTATAMINGKQIRRTKSLGKIKLAEDPKLRVELTHAEDRMPHFDQKRLPVLEIHPGETITARVVAKRLGYDQRINFGKESAALNLPFGVYVDNTGLNGVLIPPKENERTFFLTAEPWVKPCQRLIFLESAEGGKPSTNPAVLRVVPKPASADKNKTAAK